MSDTGSIHASPHSVGFRHHSSLLAGANVAGAGEMRVLAGKLVHISNKSGHYGAAAAHFLQVIHVLSKKGVSFSNTKVTFKTLTAGDGERRWICRWCARRGRAGNRLDWGWDAGAA